MRTTHSERSVSADLERRAVGIGDDLGEAVMVAQVDEQHAAMVADAMAPAGKAHLAADVARAKRAAGMAAIAVHCRLHSLFDRSGRNAESACEGAFVKASIRQFLVAGLAPATHVAARET